MKKRFVTQRSAEGVETRREELNGVEHVVVPAILLVEGVIQCMTCPTPEYVSAEEFGRIEDAWNGRPVTLTHPHDAEGNPVPAHASKEIAEEFVIGVILNAHVDGKKLKAELWINTERVAALGEEAEQTLARLEAGEDVEVSTGYFADVEEKSGKYNGRAYEGVQHNIVPDHLAVLGEESVGACSWKDGCGAPRVNAKEEPVKTTKTKAAAKQNCSCGGKTPALDANAIADIVTPYAELLTALVTNGVSDIDLRTSIESSLRADVGNEAWVWVLAVYDDAVVYAHNTKTLKRSYEVTSEDGHVKLGDDAVEVRPVTDFVPVNETINDNEGKDREMDKKAKIDSLIAHSKTRFEETDRPWLETQSDEQLEKLAPIEELKDEGDPDPKIEAKPEDEKKLNAEAPKTPEDVLANIGDPEMREMFENGLKMQRAKKQALITKITANKANPFSSKELGAKKIDELEKLATLAGIKDEADVADYSGRGGPRTIENEDNGMAPAPMQVFDLSKTAH